MGEESHGWTYGLCLLQGRSLTLFYLIQGWNWSRHRQYGKLLMRSQIDGEEPSLPRRTFVSTSFLLRLIHAESRGWTDRTSRLEQLYLFDWIGWIMLCVGNHILPYHWLRDPHNAQEASGYKLRTLRGELESVRTQEIGSFKADDRFLLHIVREGDVWPHALCLSEILVSRYFFTAMCCKWK